MNREIVGFHCDAERAWVAELDCGHGQHVRHDPPFMNRPWVVTPAGRESKLGQTLDCLRCASFELPNGFVPYKRTPDFDAHSVPAGLRSNHTTKRGIWAKIHVLEGELRYTVARPLSQEFILDETHPGIVVAEVPHKIEPLGAVRFYVEFYHKA